MPLHLLILAINMPRYLEAFIVQELEGFFIKMGKIKSEISNSF
jgi:hypothetical protein